MLRIRWRDRACEPHCSPDLPVLTVIGNAQSERARDGAIQPVRLLH